MTALSQASTLASPSHAELERHYRDPCPSISDTAPGVLSRDNTLFDCDGLGNGETYRRPLTAPLILSRARRSFEITRYTLEEPALVVGGGSFGSDRL